MEEKTFSPEQPEDVIELFDIVEPVASDDSPVQAEQGEIPSESAEACLNASSGEETADGVHDSRLPEDPDESYGEDGIPPQPSEQTQKEVSSVPPQERTEDGEEEVPSCPQEERDLSSEDDPSIVRDLETRLAALERANRELMENVESLSQQLAHVGTMFLEDASVRLGMEEMVSRMLDARLPSASDSEEPESSLAARVDALERRLKDEETGREQMAAAVAARVIRDEIAAMRAEAAGSTSR